MTEVNKAKDAFFYQKIQNGDYTVTESGSISNRAGKSLGTINSRGYVTLGALCQGKLLIIQAHRVVWMALRGPIPDGFEPTHDDGIKTHNAIANLCLKPCGSRGQQNLTREENSRNAKLTETQVIKARRLVAANISSIRKLAQRFNVSPATLRSAVTGKTWTGLAQTPVAVIPRGKSQIDRYAHKFKE